MHGAYLATTICCVGCVCFFIGRFTHLSYLTIGALTLVVSGYLVISNPVRGQTSDTPLATQLETIRAKYNVPALGGAIFTTDGLKEMAVTGTRKRGDATPVTANDLWHLGSDTKAMTATLAGTFVAEGKLKWDDKVASFFPDIANGLPPDWRNTTVREVLSHTAGLRENLNWAQYAALGNLREQRKAAVRDALTGPQWRRGEYHYSNTDYVVIGAILEKIGGKPWEDLMRERLFQPLGITSAGFGGLGTPGHIDQPWPHDDKGTPSNGPTIDNPEVMGPAGTAHMTMTDWSKFLTDQLRGGSGMKALLATEIYTSMQTAVPPSQYGFGWLVVQRPWAGGKALNHAGSNTLNFCVAWLAPNKKFGVLAVCNQGGDTAFKACDEAVGLFIQRYKN